MIYTLTLNPSLDCFATVAEFAEGKIHSIENQVIRPGGKGINVSCVLTNLAVDNVALGILAGFTGSEIKRLLEERGVKNDFLLLEQGRNRMNVKLLTGRETQLNETGPVISEEDLHHLKGKLCQLTKEDYLILSGSIPKSVPSSIYADICEFLQERGVRVIVDAVGETLRKTLSFSPFFIKPNREELGEFFCVEITGKEDAIVYGRKLQEMGARNVIVSLGEEGAILIDETGKVWFGAAPSGKVVSTVGAGDSLVAGFTAGLVQTGSYEEALCLGLAAGSASAFSAELATKEDIHELKEQIIVVSI